MSTYLPFNVSPGVQKQLIHLHKHDTHAKCKGVVVKKLETTKSGNQKFYCEYCEKDLGGGGKGWAEKDIGSSIKRHCEGLTHNKFRQFREEEENHQSQKKTTKKKKYLGRTPSVNSVIQAPAPAALTLPFAPINGNVTSDGDIPTTSMCVYIKKQLETPHKPPTPPQSPRRIVSKAKLSLHYDQIEAMMATVSESEHEPEDSLKAAEEAEALRELTAELSPHTRGLRTHADHSPNTYLGLIPHTHGLGAAPTDAQAIFGAGLYSADVSPFKSDALAPVLSHTSFQASPGAPFASPPRVALTLLGAGSQASGGATSSAPPSSYSLYDGSHFSSGSRPSPDTEAQALETAWPDSEPAEDLRRNLFGELEEP